MADKPNVHDAPDIEEATRQVVEILRDDPSKSYRDVDRELNQYFGYARYHAQRYMRKTGESLFADDDGYKRSNDTSGKTWERSSPKELSEDDLLVHKMRLEGKSYSQIESELGQYYGYAGYHARRYERLANSKEPELTEKERERNAKLETAMQMLMDGSTLTAACEETGLPRYRIKQRLTELGLPQVRELRMEQLSAPACRLREEGKSYAAICRELGLKYTTVKAILAENSTPEHDLLKPLRKTLTKDEARPAILCRAAGDTLSLVSAMFNVGKSALGAFFRKLSPDDQAFITKIRSMLSHGSSVDEIAEEMHLSEEDRDILQERVNERAAGQMNVPGMELTPAQTDGVRSLMDGGRTAREMAELLSWPLRKVYTAMHAVERERQAAAEEPV